MIEMTLGKALRLKKRLGSKIKQLDDLIKECNRSQEGDGFEYDILELMSERSIVMDALISVKSTIDRANEPIRELIYRMSELKSYKAMLSQMKVNPRAERIYGDSSVKYDLQLGKKDRDKLASEAQKELDAVQEQLDVHNATNKVQIHESMVNLV